MENNNEFLDAPQANSNQSLSDSDLSLLFEAGWWAKFLGIIGFIFTGFLALMSLLLILMGSAMSNMAGTNGIFALMGFTTIGIIYLGFTAVWFFLILYMYRFGAKARNAVRQGSMETMSESFKNLRNYFRLSGWITIIGLVLYIVLIFVFISLGASAARF